MATDVQPTTGVCLIFKPGNLNALKQLGYTDLAEKLENEFSKGKDRVVSEKILLEGEDN